ncbi:MAG: bifunctional diguanylate cyclase/phosphodiesterase [Lachnospiraceae bacterium]|nr:bifunctional diguanylate cyclase/phosphodiesterase [Lachnospiraceae bacterium]
MDELHYQVDLLNAMNSRLKADERMYRLVCSTSLNAIIYIDCKKGSVKTLANWDSFFPGLEINSVSDISKLYSYIEEPSVLSFRDLIHTSKANETVTEVFRMSDNKTYVEVEVRTVYDETGCLTDKVIRFKDVTKIHAQNDELAYMAYYDSNTGLINRNYFVSKLSNLIKKAEEENAVVSVMFIDLDGFHTINDGMGIVVGDEIIQIFGQLLKKYESENVLVSHFNMDIYCMAIYNPGGSLNANIVFHELKENIREPIRLTNGAETLISFCAGVADYPESASGPLELINCAEIVMFKAKDKGRGQIQYFDAPILKDFLVNVNIENKLKEAVFNENFTMNFQPQFFAEDKKLRGFEALIRWKDQNGEMISPSVFIPIAEKNGAIIPIGNFVIKESIRTFVQWKKRYDVDMILSINISAVQYRTDNFVESVLDIISTYEVDPGDIELEITESFLIEDFNDVMNKLEILREYGVRVSLDDFGTGYSSLSYLKGLPIDTLKIDKEFVDSISSDENARIILDTIIYMTKKLGFETIAEGVETKEQFDYLKSIGCDCIQGFYLAKPTDSAGIEKLLTDRTI